MPWSTPTLRTVREMVRNDVSAALSGAVLIGNSVLRVMSDAMGGAAHLVLRYMDWLALQLLPDTAETEWLDRHGIIWLTNSDGSKGRKVATYSEGVINMTGTNLFVVPVGTELSGLGVRFETTDNITMGVGPTPAPVRALDAGTIGNLNVGETMTFDTPIAGIDTSATVVSIDGGTDTETDDQLRARVLFRIQNPPMGGDLADYVLWATAVPGVTRAWAATELGPGSVTVRFMMDDLRSGSGGIPNTGDKQTVRDYINTQRPVTVKDLYVDQPIQYFYDLTISALDDDSPTVRARIEASIRAMEMKRSKPGQTMYRSWVDEAISAAVGENHHELTFVTQVMPSAGYMPFLGTITYA